MQTRSQSKTRSRAKTQKAAAATKIQRFFKRTETPRKIAFLKAVCSDSGECVMFGKEIQNIKRVFNDFKLDHAESLKIHRIGAVSRNGFVVEVPFTRGNYKAYGVLKSSIDPQSDNLFYEAFVGIFINKKHKFYPCFVETYASYFYEDKNVHSKLEEGKFVKKDEFTKGVVEVAPLSYKSLLKPALISKSCEQSQFFSLLIQHIKGASSIGAHVNSLKHDKDFMTVHLVSYLFQVYCPLAAMANDFTHYDLHGGNVLIYTPSICVLREHVNYMFAMKYIRMIYHYSDGSTVEFNTFGIAKIIDYGRSYMNDNTEYVKSRDFYNYLCKEDKCNYYKKVDAKGDDSQDDDKKFIVYKCGEYYGYSILHNESVPGYFHYISSQKRNKSHDLRLIDIIWKTENKYKGENANPLRAIMANTVYEDKFSLKEHGYDNGYGTPEVPKVTYEKPFDEIKNVEDMHLALKYLITNKESYFALENERIFQGKTKIGEMHIWVDESKPMEYVPS